MSESRSIPKPERSTGPPSAPGSPRRSIRPSTTAAPERRARCWSNAPGAWPWRRNAPAAPVDALELLPFRLGREHYAIETRYAREVVRLTGFTKIPSTEDFLLGVTNLRGEIVPVFDLMLFFGFASQGLSDRSRVIVVGAEEVEFGIIADSVQAVAEFPIEALVAEAVFEGKRGGECVRGVTRDAMIVLDGAALIKDRRLFIGSAPEAAGVAAT